MEIINALDRYIVVNPFFNGHFWIVVKFCLGLLNIEDLEAISKEIIGVASQSAQLSDEYRYTLLQG